MRSIWTIGHSNHASDHFQTLLHENDIRFLVDVRSSPYSRYSPQFDRQVLQTSLRSIGTAYTFFGDDLGGRPPEPELYDSEGRVKYYAVARLHRFRNAIERLVSGSEGHRIAVMCSEENPEGCHRRLLVGRVLTSFGLVLRHIRGDGRVEEEPRVDLAGPDLFGTAPDEEQVWKSIRSVSHARQLKNFSSGSSIAGHVP
ncbi:MAG: hypothetical protein QOI11_1061 [Candidatus Eremiobacteraeota bacterium]|nr:hypothetical protein [Candidatus Eremiobacteraeota bacterium]